MLRLARGTKEYLPVDVVDNTGVTTSLASATPKYDVYSPSDTLLVNQGTPSISNMRLSCLIDSATVPGNYPAGKYRLFVNFTVGSEIPRLGPFYFELVEKDLYV